MTTDDATKIIQETRPEQVFLTHLGMKMLLEGPAKEARLIQEKTGVPTTAAADGMVVSLSETVTVRKPDGTDQRGLPNYF
jgi:phosphoribosyl 1,2-cyclic phosphodiesterase